MSALTVLSALEHHFRTRPDEVFCTFMDEGQEDLAITYRDLSQESSRYAAFFEARGIRPGEVVLIILKHSPQLLYSFLGAMRAGAIPSFMPFPSGKQDPVKYWSSHQELFARIGAGGILTYPDNARLLTEKISLAGLQVMLADQTAGLPVDYENVPDTPERIALLQHSSGTTGLKKGVALSFGAVARQVESYASALPITAADRIASWLPLYHDMGLIACFMTPITLGVPIVWMDPFAWVSRPVLLLEAIERYRATLAWLPNFAYHHICRNIPEGSQYNLESLRALIDCSEPCKAESLELFASTFESCGGSLEKMQVCYAMAETVFAVTQTPLGKRVPSLLVDREALRVRGRVEAAQENRDVERILSVGVPVPGIRVSIRGDDGETLPEGRVGEVAVAAPFLFSGYFKNPDATAAALRGEWFYTGDMGCQVDGELFILGRRKELIIVYGKNFYANDLEFSVNQVAGVKPGRCVALGSFHEESGSEELIVVAELDEGKLPESAAVRKAVKLRLAQDFNLSPKDIRMVPAGWLVKTTSGKIARGENLQKYLHERQRVELVGTTQ